MRSSAPGSRARWTSQLPGRLERRSDSEIWDGGHNPDGLDWALPRLPAGSYTVVASILRDKDVDGMLERLARVGETLRGDHVLERPGTARR